MSHAVPPARDPAPNGRRPVSQQRYAVRRLGVLIVLGLLVFGGIKGVDTLTGGESGPEANASGATTTTADSSIDPGTAGQPATMPSTTPPTAPPTAPPTEPERTGPPTEDNPAEVLLLGDSDAGVFAPYLERLLDELGIVDVEVDYVVSSGLARPDFHDWPQHLRDTLATSDPDIIIVTFGGNDTQGLAEPCANGPRTCRPSFQVGLPEQNTEEWTAEYVRRVHEVMDIMLDDTDRTVVWVGIPNASDEIRTERLQIQDQAVRQALESYPDVVFVDTWRMFVGRNGGIAELIVDPRDGKAKPVRQSDGFHLNSDGAEILAIEIAEAVEDVLRDLGADV